MTRDEHRNACIEAQAKAIYLRRFPDADVDDHFAWYYGGDANPQSSVHYSNVAIAILDAIAAFDSLPTAGADVVPVEATAEMLMRGSLQSTLPGIWRAMRIAGALTNPSEGKP
jgi:hypothetical protein